MFKIIKAETKDENANINKNKDDENFDQHKEEKGHIFKIIKAKKNIENENSITDKNKDEGTKKLERKDEMPKCEISNNGTMSYGKSNDKKEKDQNIEKDIITTNNLEERQNEILD